MKIKDRALKIIKISLKARCLIILVSVKIMNQNHFRSNSVPLKKKENQVK